MGDLTANANIRGRAIDLALAWSDPSTSARSLRVARRRRGYPTDLDDGLLVLDLADLFVSSDLADLFVSGDVPWARIDRTRFLVVNTPAEGGLLQAEIAEYYTAASGASPSRVIARAYDDTTGQLEPVNAATLSVPFDRQEVQRTVATLLSSAPLDISFVTSVVTAASSQEAGVPICAVRFTETLNPDTGERDRTITISDRGLPARAAQGRDAGDAGGLVPGVAYYYLAVEDLGKKRPRTWTASAVVTGRHGFAEKLYQLLPAIHRYYDDPAGGKQGSFQLRRFLEIFGPGLDQARSLGEALSTRHDLFEVQADHLTYLAHWIGWEPDRTLPTQRQRNDVLFAPEVYATVGTVPNIRALVNRATGWDCRVKEFVKNVFLTNAVEPIHLWEIWEATGPIDGFGPTTPVKPEAVTHAVSDSIDARPAIVADHAGGAPWLFWHSDRPVSASSTPGRHLWMMRADGTGPAQPVKPKIAGEIAGEWPTAIAEDNTIRLFWSSNRGGRRGLSTLTLTGGIPGEPIEITNHPAGDDQYPAAVREAGGRIWLFWQSSRRGPTDIWAMTLEPGADARTKWSAPQRIATGRPRAGTPSAVFDHEKKLHLFWSDDSGDRSRILHSIHDGATWSDPPVDISSGPTPSAVPYFRDEAPAVVLLNDSLWAFWHSDRDGIARLWASQETGSSWGAPFPVTTGRSTEKDPAPLITATGTLRLFFRTQRGGEVFRSRTVDFTDLGAIKQGQSEDRWHYTYSTTITSSSFYARDVVGLYLMPDEVNTLAAHESEVTRVKALVEPFRPAPVQQFVWVLEPQVVTESLYSPVDIGESYTDVYALVDHLGDIDETCSVALPGWSVLRTNTPGDVSADPGDLTTLRRRVFFTGFT
jgi:phage tail-like protein